LILCPAARHRCAAGDGPDAYPVKLARYIARRLVLLVPVLLGVSIFTFVLIRVLPGDPVRTVMPQTATPADILAARHRFGLDRPIIAQYWIWLKDLLHGRLGNSFQTGVDIRTEFLHRIGPTFELVTLALLLALVVAIPLGSSRQRGPARRATI